MEKKELVAALHEALGERHSIDAELHNDHHEFIDMLREREKRRIALWQKFRLSFVGALATTLVGVLIWLGGLVLSAWKHSA